MRCGASADRQQHDRQRPDRSQRQRRRPLHAGGRRISAPRRRTGGGPAARSRPVARGPRVLHVQLWRRYAGYEFGAEAMRPRAARTARDVVLHLDVPVPRRGQRVPHVGGRLRRRRDVHGLERDVSRQRLRSSRRRAAPPPASATCRELHRVVGGLSCGREEHGRLPRLGRSSATRPETCDGVGNDCPADALAAERRRVPSPPRASATSPRTATGSSTTARPTTVYAPSTDVPWRRPASATWPRAATALGAPVRPTRSSRPSRSAAPSPASATSPRAARERAPRVRPTLPADHGRVPRLGGRLRLGRELHRIVGDVSGGRQAARSCAAPGSGVCDAAESCDGVGDDCPADAFEPSHGRAAPRRASATSRRAAPARAPRVRPTRSSRQR